MQVNHVQDHCTHAVIGGKQSIEFGISNSAEFFNILSSTLYKDQILAVVREVLCNAWDAHIEAQRTDLPVLVTLEPEKLVIKDMGKGIHHDDMGLIYGTYGNSTKKNDGNQTGGFGLGCKSPFAYTDHFEVISCHEGVKTIYNMSKSSAQAQGKPGITPIASFPTTDTGLTVTIRIKQADHNRFELLINRIVHNGDMNVLLNSKQINTIGFDLSKGNYLITRADMLDTASRIMVRYGNVIYPVEATEAIVTNYLAIQSHLDKLQFMPYASKRYSIVFQAPAHSISVTPSREALSMQEHTVATLNKLFTDFLALLEKDFEVECDRYAEAITRRAVDTKRIDLLLKTQNQLPNLHYSEPIPSISDLATMAKVYMRTNYPPELAYRKADITRRLELMVTAGLLDRGKVRTFLLELKNAKGAFKQIDRYNHYEPNTWLQRRVVAPVLKKLYQEGMDTSRLFVCNSADYNWKAKSVATTSLVPATSARPRSMFVALPYLRNIVVLSSRKSELVEQAYKQQVFKDTGTYEGFLVYIVGKKKGDTEAARQFFGKQGMRVCDLTLLDAPTVRAPRNTSAPRKPIKKGIPCVSSVLDDHGTERIDINRCRSETVTRIDQPEFVIKVSNRQSTPSYYFEGWGARQSYVFAKLFGDKGGIVATTAAYDAWLAKGAVGHKEYLMDKVCDYILDNQRIANYWSTRPYLVQDAVGNASLVELIYTNKTFMKAFGIVEYLTDEDHLYLELWKECENRWYVSDKIAAVKNWFKQIPSDNSIQVLIDKLNNPLVCLLDVYSLSIMLQDRNPSPQQDTAIQFVISVINR